MTYEYHRLEIKLDISLYLLRLLYLLYKSFEKMSTKVIFVYTIGIIFLEENKTTLFSKYFVIDSDQSKKLWKITNFQN